MARISQDVTDAELAVLQALWDRGPTTIRELTEALYPRGSTAHYATVQKLLERLETKRCVKRDRKEWPHVFTATVDRGHLIGRRLKSVADKLCDGSLTPLLTHLIRGDQLSAAERQSLRGLLDELEGEAGRREQAS
jgi:predicted transcriptional regulator